MDVEQTRREFDSGVNMTATELERWLGTAESAGVGQHEGGESVGHRSGRCIVEILRKNREELSDDDYEHMRAVVGYLHRHRAQRPSGDVRDTRGVIR